MSKLKAFFMPVLSEMIFAVAGKSMSGVTVAQMRRSISSGDVFVFSSRPLTACSPRSDVAFPSPFRILLSFIPTRCIIHSSVVSTIVDSSLLVRRYSGTHPLIPVIAALVFVMLR